MTYTYDDGEGIYLGDEIEVPAFGVALLGPIAEIPTVIPARILQIRKDGKRLRVQHISDHKDTIEWVDTKGCEMIRRNQ